MQQLLIELQYLPPISYFQLLLSYERVWLEKGDSFNKSTYRNRCYIAGPHHPLRLTIPIQGGKSHRTYYKDAKISYTEDWQKDHWQSLSSCYRSSPYFEFYEDTFAPFFRERYTYLYELNHALLLTLFDLLELNVSISFTTVYDKEFPEGDDFRDCLLPGQQTSRQTSFQPLRYHQVFEDRTRFVPDLSIVDLLFNEGPNAAGMLYESIR